MLSAVLLPLALAAALAQAPPALEPPPGVLDRAAALAIAHDGCAGLEERARLLAELPAAADLRALIAAGALRPPRLAGELAALAPAAQSRALALALEGFLAGAEEREPELIYERVRGHLDTDALALLAAEVRAGLAAAGPGGAAVADAVANARGRRALELLLAASFALAAELWGELALDPGVDLDARLQLLDRWVRACGRPALDRALAALLPDAPPEARRQLVGLMNPMLEPADLALLRELAFDPVASVADAAYQLWARHETDPARRRQIFDQALQRPAAARFPALLALSRNAQEPELAEALVAMLDAPNPAARELADRILPAFLAPAPLFEAYRARLPGPDRPRERSAWMVPVARIPVPEARRLAAHWLADGGWNSTPQASIVIRELQDQPEIESLLPRLLATRSVPEDLRWSLALGCAAASEDARLFLRLHLVGSVPLRQQQAVRALVAAGDRGDLPLLQEVAAGPDFDLDARAAALEGLAALPEGRRWLLELLAGEPPEWELRAALVRGLIRHGDAAERAAATHAAHAGAGLAEEEEERLALELVAWQSQEAAPRAAEEAALVAELLDVLAAAPVLFAEGMPDPRRTAAALPRVHACARALAAVLAGGASAELPGGLPEGPSAAILHAASVLARVAPAPVHAWCLALAERPGLEPSLRLRALGTVAQAAFALGPDPAAGALVRLLEWPAALRDFPWDLAHGLGSDDARSWNLPGDRLREELLLARAELAAGAERLALLEALLPGYAAPSNLLDAGARALDTAGGEELAERLAQRALDWAPLDPRPRRLLARIARARGDSAAAVEAEAAAARLEPAGLR